METEKTYEKLISEIEAGIVHVSDIRNEIGTPCLICGEGVPVGWHFSGPKICEKCKAAVMKVREQDG